MVSSIIHCVGAPDSTAETKVRNSDFPGMVAHAFRQGSQEKDQAGHTTLRVVSIGIYFKCLR